MVRMIDPTDGTHLVCCWEDCHRPGNTMYQAIVREAPDIDPELVLSPTWNLDRSRLNIVHYLFCSERHKMLWVHSYISYGNRPAGSRGILG